MASPRWPNTGGGDHDAGSNRDCFPAKAKCRHWREGVILNKNAPGLRAGLNLKFKVASVQKMDRLGGGESSKAWQRAFPRYSFFGGGSCAASSMWGSEREGPSKPARA